MLTDPILFLHPPKTGGVSVHVGLRDTGIQIVRPDPATNGLDWHDSLENIRKKYPLQDYFVLSIRRCPFRRAVSYYFFAREYQQHQAAMDLTFDEFITYDFPFVRRILFPCWHYTKQADYVIDYDHLADDFNRVCRAYGKRMPIPHQHRGKYNRRDIRSLYTNKSRAIVEDMMKDDIVNFGYSFDNIGR